MNVGLISLGCAKNLIDSENIVKSILGSGHNFHEDLNLCECVIINTCTFIDEAKEEAIDNILEMGLLKEDRDLPLKKIVVAGCLAERYGENLKSEMPEIDIVVPIRKNSEIPSMISDKKLSVEDEPPYVRFTPIHWGFLRISDGCSNNCSYCVIPSVRGPIKSLKKEELFHMAEELSDSGAKEINIIAQDSANWGIDIYGKKKIADLLEKLDEIEEVKWFRLLYFHPDHVDDELIQAIKKIDRVVNYIELPMQHVSKRIIKSMNRRTYGNDLIRLVEKIRKELKDVTIRSSFIIGYPGETEEEFEELCEFLKTVKLDRVALFRYSKEDSTKAGQMKNQIPEDIKIERMNRIIKIQNKIYRSINLKLKNKIFDGLVESVDPDTNLAWVRTCREAPEVDGYVFVSYEDDSMPQPGDFVKIRITHSKNFNNYGVVL